MPDGKFEVKIELQRSDLSVSIIYKTKELTTEDISIGLWYNSEVGIEHVMAPFIKVGQWHLLQEAIGHWINDDFNEVLPFSLVRNLNGFRPDILIDSLNETTLNLSINKVVD